MAIKNMNAVLRLRQDMENNFSRSNIILQSGEIAIVQTSLFGKKIKIGDGKTPFNNLEFATLGLLVRGILINETTFNDEEGNVVNPNNHLFFINSTNNGVYFWDGSKYVYVNKQIADLPIASDTVAGIMKLYDTIDGENIDGSVTQKALNTVAKEIQKAANNVIGNIDNFDNEQLNVDLKSLQKLNLF